MRSIPTAQAPNPEQQNGAIQVEEAHPIDALLAEAAATFAPGAPTEHPPAAALAVEEVAAVGAWLADKRVNALWCINQNRNVYMGVAGVGWKKLANNSDSAIIAFTTLASHARAVQARIDYREEPDGRVHECRGLVLHSRPRRLVVPVVRLNRIDGVRNQLTR